MTDALDRRFDGRAFEEILATRSAATPIKTVLMDHSSVTLDAPRLLEGVSRHRLAAVLSGNEFVSGHRHGRHLFLARLRTLLNHPCLWELWVPARLRLRRTMDSLHTWWEHGEGGRSDA
jgi:hypothetical protein